jgi:DNA-binding SARP family transcriptional activator/predicted ATPase
MELSTNGAASGADLGARNKRLTDGNSPVLATVEFCFFGQASIVVAGKAVEALAWQRTDAKRLLYALVLKHDHRYNRDQLCALLWGDIQKQSARTKLTNTLYSLRKALGDAGQRVLASTEWIAFKWDASVRFDVEAFERRLDAAGCCTELVEKQEELELAVRLYRGDLLHGLQDRWVEQDRTLLKVRRLWALEELVKLYQRQSLHQQAIECQRQRVEAEPLDQQGHATLLTLLMGAGQLEQAVLHYKRCRDITASELGQAPSEQIQVLYTQIKAQYLSDTAKATNQSTPITAFNVALTDGQRKTTVATTLTTASALTTVSEPAAALIQRPLSTTIFSIHPSKGQYTYTYTATAPLGRHHDTQALLKLLLEPKARAHLFTLTGFGGVGKTTLAHHVREAWPDAVRLLTHGTDKRVKSDRTAERTGKTSKVDTVETTQTTHASEPFGEPRTAFIDVSEIATKEALAEKIKQTLGLPVSLLSQEATAVVAGDGHESIGGLVVIDNYEHLIEHASVLTKLQERCAHLKILVTSRIALHVPDEIVYPLQPLKITSDAVTLFIDQARARNAMVQFDETERKAIVGVCAKLDGLPLAIKLAAARTRLFTPQSLLARLNTDLKLLHSSGSVSAQGPGRRSTASTGNTGNTSNTAHRSLLGILEWTVNLLSPSERELLVWLRVFQGGFTVDAVEHIFAKRSDTVADLLEALIDHHLIVPMRPVDREAEFEIEIGAEYDGRLDERLEARATELSEPEIAGYDYVATDTVESLQLAKEPDSVEPRWMLLETVKQHLTPLVSSVDPTQQAAAAHAQYYIDTMMGLMADDEFGGSTSAFFETEADNLCAALNAQLLIAPQAVIVPLTACLKRLMSRGLRQRVVGWLEALNRNKHRALSKETRELIDAAVLPPDSHPEDENKASCALTQLMKNCRGGKDSKPPDRRRNGALRSDGDRRRSLLSSSMLSAPDSMLTT